MYYFHFNNKHVRYLCVPNHIGIGGNEMADHLTCSTKQFFNFFSFKTPIFLSFSNPSQYNLDSLETQMAFPSSIPQFLALKHLSSNFLSSWYGGLDHPRSQIDTFSRLRFGHNLLRNYTFPLFLNYSLLCTLHITEVVCGIYYIMFYYPFIIS